MKKKSLEKKQALKFLLYNLAAFLLIFLILGIVAVTVIDGYFYHEADNELSASREALLREGTENPDRPAQDKPGGPKGNPRVSYMIYDGSKSLHYTDLPGYLDYGNLGAPDGSEKIYNTKISSYNYRVSEFSYEQDGSVFYARVLINIDGETGLRNNIVSIYLICLSVIIVLTLGASFAMSRITMRPVAKAMKEQTRFVSDASHELRTPLTVLHSRLEQLLSYPDTKLIDKSEDISDCLSEVMRLTKLSNGLLTLARSDADKAPPEMSGFDIFGLAGRVAAPYIEMAECQGKTFSVSGESVTVTADKKQIMQVLIILFDNALKYTDPSDSINVSVSKVKNKCQVAVSDTGIGISEKGIKHIFERFYRDDNSRGKREGSGLGLSIAKQIIEGHKGSVSAQNNQPKGTTVIVIL